MKAELLRWFIPACLAIFILAFALHSFAGIDQPEATPKPPGPLKSNSSGQIWTDLKSKLIWQIVPPDDYMTYQSAKLYCEDLVLNEFNDWRLPTINELRSLIRGCSITALSGQCGVTDACLKTSCRNDICGEECFQDASGLWPSEMKGKCGLYWSSSLVEDKPDSVWLVDFHLPGLDGCSLYHGIINETKDNDQRVRCVRRVK